MEFDAIEQEIIRAQDVVIQPEHTVRVCLKDGIKALDIVPSQEHVDLESIKDKHWTTLMRYLKTEKLERASKLIALLSGESAHSRKLNTFIFPQLELRIVESAFAEADLGWRTWGAAVLTSKLLLSDFVEIPVNSKILELGSGTGLVGLVLSKHHSDVTLTDYHPSVLSNLRENVQLNASGAKVMQLDWTWFKGEQLSSEVEALRHSIDFLVASDVLYSIEHAECVPRVIKHLLKPSGRVLIVIPLRPRYTEEVSVFQELMANYTVLYEQEYYDPYNQSQFKLPSSTSDLKQGCFYRVLLLQ